MRSHGFGAVTDVFNKYESINGEPRRLTVATGLSKSALTKRLARRLELYRVNMRPMATRATLDPDDAVVYFLIRHRSPPEFDFMIMARAMKICQT